MTWFWRLWPHKFRYPGVPRAIIDWDESCRRCGRSHHWHHEREFGAVKRQA